MLQIAPSICLSVVILLATMVGSSATAQVGHQSTADPFQPVEELIQKGKIRKAIAGLEALEAIPSYALDARLRRALLAYENGGESADFFALLEQNLEADPSHWKTLMCRGSVYIELGMNDRAEADFKAVLRAAGEVDSIKSKGLSGLGSAYKLGQRFDEALAAHERGLAIDSLDYVHRVGKAGVLDDLGRIDESIVILEGVLRDRPEDWVVLNNLGFIYIRAKRFDDAVQIYDTCLDIEPESGFAWSNRANAKMHMGQYDEALDNIHRAIKLMPSNSWAYRNLGLIHLAVEDKDAACEAWRDARAWGFASFYGPEVDQLIREHCR